MEIKILGPYFMGTGEQGFIGVVAEYGPYHIGRLEPYDGDESKKDEICARLSESVKEMAEADLAAVADLE